MKVTYVVQRYGAQIVGGAEAACRQFATRLAARGHEVTVLTSCATDANTWANALPAGESLDAGVRVVRYATTQPRDPGFDRLSHRLFGLAEPDAALEERWIEAQGPLVPDLIAAIDGRGPDLWVFYTYLYYPTLMGLPKVAGRSVLHPALHDEPPSRLARVRDVLRSPAGIYLHSPEEWELVLARAGWPPAELGLVGLGAEEGFGNVGAFRVRAGIGDDPYLLYLGRVEDGKGTGDLARMFSAYARSHPGPMKLVIAGPVTQAPPPADGVVVTGVLTDAERWGAMEGATAFIHPSPLESFAIVLFEAWSKGRPVLVNGACRVTAGHAARSRGGLAYRDYAEFSAALELILDDPVVAHGLGANGKAYAESFAWDAVMDRYEAFLGRVLASIDRRAV